MNISQVLLLGVGNTLLCDEGFGIKALYYLQENYQWPDNFTLVDGGTRGLLLMSELMECDLAVILDIIKMGQEPGTIYCLDGDDLGKTIQHQQSLHQTGINDILICCELADKRPETLIFGIEPFNYECVSTNLSEGAQKILPEFCTKVVNELKKLGFIDILPKAVS